MIFDTFDAFRKRINKVFNAIAPEGHTFTADINTATSIICVLFSEWTPQMETDKKRDTGFASWFDEGLTCNECSHRVVMSGEIKEKYLDNKRKYRLYCLPCVLKKMGAEVAQP